ncbi:MAG: hypothetical protein ACYCYK_12375, partial [Candidatus Dormibacteria bacterium]
FLSRNEGMPLTVKSGGLRLWVWQKEIERAHQRLADESRQVDKQADADLRNQEWLARKQDAWNEYRRQHPQDPGQGG